PAGVTGPDRGRLPPLPGPHGLGPEPVPRAGEEGVAPPGVAVHRLPPGGLEPARVVTVPAAHQGDPQCRGDAAAEGAGARSARGPALPGALLRRTRPARVLGHGAGVLRGTAPPLARVAPGRLTRITSLLCGQDWSTRS